MPRYFFHSEDGHLFHDAEGTELADDQAARADAVRVTGELLADRPQMAWETTRWRLLTTDETGRILFTIELRAEVGSAVLPWT